MFVIRFFLAALVPVLAIADEASSKRVEPVIATVETTLTTASGQIRQFAFDGDRSTYFLSAQAPSEADHFTLALDRPVAVTSIAVVSGKADGTEALDSGSLEVSADGKAFELLARFVEGSAKGTDVRGEVRAIRIKPGVAKHPVAIREVTIESNPPVAVFRYPIEFVVDVTDAPEMKGWADRAARLCERWYLRINEELKSDGFKPPHRISMALKSSYKGVAEAGGGRIVGSVAFFKAHPDDFGAMIHETCHIVQRYQGRGNPGWLVEGVADYVRFFVFEPGKIGRINADPHYNDSYRTTAAFLAFVTDKYDKQLVLKLNTLMREGKYKHETFKELTGKTLEQLDGEWRASLGK